MDDDAFQQLLELAKEAQEGSGGDWVFNEFLKNSFPGLSKVEAMKKLNEFETEG